MDQSSETVAAITRRFTELFGSIAAEKAGIRFVKSEDGMTIIKCRLDHLDSVLVAIAMTDPPVITLDMSGNIKRLRRRHQGLS
jgi:RNase P/RNase MRP subunit POP5